MSFAIMWGYPQDYFQPKIGRKNKNIETEPENYSYLKKERNSFNPSLKIQVLHTDCHVFP